MARERVGPSGASDLLPMEDADLPFVLRVKSGDTEAFRPLWVKYESALFQFFLKQTGSRQEAEDLASETLIAALQSIPTFRGATRGSGSSETERACSFRTYLRAVARHKLAGYIRRKRVRNEVAVADYAFLPAVPGTAQDPESYGCNALSIPGAADGQDGLSIAPNPLDAVVETDEKDAVCLAVANIGSSAQFKVVLLHYFGGLSHQDVATLLSTRSDTVNTRLQDARRAFKRQLTDLLEEEEEVFSA